MIEIYNVAIVPLITALIQLMKMYGLPAKYSPLMSVLVGILLSITYITTNLKDGIMVGLIFGLSASGLYSSGKSMMKNSKKDSEP